MFKLPPSINFPMLNDQVFIWIWWNCHVHFKVTLADIFLQEVELYWNISLLISILWCQVCHNPLQTTKSMVTHNTSISALQLLLLLQLLSESLHLPQSLYLDLYCRGWGSIKFSLTETTPDVLGRRLDESSLNFTTWVLLTLPDIQHTCVLILGLNCFVEFLWMSIVIEFAIAAAAWLSSNLLIRATSMKHGC